MKRITMNLLDLASVQNAKRELEFYKNSIKTKLLGGMQELAEKADTYVKPWFVNFEGRDVQPWFVNPVGHTYDEAEVKAYSSDVEGKGNEYVFTVNADGKGAAFLEFGAGLMTDESHPLADNVPFAVHPGSYSEEHAREYSTYGYWYFNGERYYWKMPTRGLYRTSNYIKENAQDVMARRFEK